MPQHSELKKNNRFLVYIGIHKLAFSKVSGLGSGIEKEIYVEGGGLNYPHVMRTPKSQLRSITLERGLQIDNKIIKNMNPGTFVPWVQIIMINEAGIPCYEYFLEEAWITKWEIAELNAMNNEILIDRIEIEYVRFKKESLE